MPSASLGEVPANLSVTSVFANFPGPSTGAQGSKPDEDIAADADADYMDNLEQIARRVLMGDNQPKDMKPSSSTWRRV